MTPMPDGIRLAADIYSPALDGTRAPGTFPVILERTPYNKAAAGASDQGQVFRAARLRVRDPGPCAAGLLRKGSGTPSPRRRKTVYATVEWLGAQPWSTGKVGTMGDSYAGSDQSATGRRLNPPHLGNHDRGGRRLQLLPQLDAPQTAPWSSAFFIYALRMAATSKEAEADPALKTALQQVLMEKVPEMVRQFPLKAGTTLLRRLPSYERWALDVLTHADYDDYWKGFRGYTPSEYYDEHADVPTLYWGRLVRLLCP